MSQPTQKFLPVSQLSGYTARWCIKARVIDLQCINYRSGNGGTILSVDLMDKDQGQIRAKFWNDAAEKWQKVLEKGHIYTFRNGRARVADKRFNNLAHNYELSFGADAEIVKVEEDTLIPSQRKHNFVSLREIKNSARECPYTVDLLCVVRSVGETSQVVSRRSGDTLTRRSIMVVDASEFELELTLWNQHAEAGEWASKEGAVLAVQNMQVREWRGRAGQSSGSSNFSFSHAGTEVDKLSDWYGKNGSSVAFRTMQDQASQMSQEGSKPTMEGNLETIYADVGGLSLIEGSKFYSTVCQTSKLYFTSRDGDFSATYPACPGCNKKVPASLHCEACGRNVEAKYRYMVATMFSDDSGGGFRARMFHESATAVLPLEAGEAGRCFAGSAEDKAKVQEAFQCTAAWQRVKVVFKARVETYDGTERTQVTVVRLNRLNLDEHAGLLLQEIQRLVPAATTPQGGCRKRTMEEEIAVDTKRFHAESSVTA